MLRGLRIKDFAIIDELEIDFDPAMSVLTGETGAGKSIIIDALGLILGSRAYSEYVRTGAREARVEAFFDVSGRPDIIERLRERDLAEGDELIVRRTVSLKGPNRADVNGRMVPVGVLAELTAGLVDIYGQHEHHSLLRPESHLEMLDHHGGHGDLVGRYAEAWREMCDSKRKIAELTKSESERAARLDYLKFVVSEIDGANIRRGEMENLRNEREVLRNARQLLEAAGGAYEAIYGAEDSIAGALASIAENLRRAARLDERLAPIAEAVDSGRYIIEDAAQSARNYTDDIEENPNRLDEIEERLEILQRLSKKYGGSLDDVLDHRDKCADEMESLEKGEKSIEQLNRRLAEATKTAKKLAGELTESRIAAAKSLRKEVERELAELGMPKSRFEMKFHRAEDENGLGPNGAETGEFYLTTNPGEEPRPLIKIASGGELSRIMLALKKILAGSSRVPTLIFDEVDAGVGGAAAEVVGRKLRSLSAGAQVLCVTHLAQIAALAQNHYFVSKNEEKRRTVTRVKKLDADGRVDEVARMLGGVDVTSATRSLAREMLEASTKKA